jgi:hypothetical protein
VLVLSVTVVADPDGAALSTDAADRHRTQRTEASDMRAAAGVGLETSYPYETDPAVVHGFRHGFIASNGGAESRDEFRFEVGQSPSDVAVVT